MRSQQNNAFRVGLVALALYLAAAAIASANEQVFREAITSTVFVISPVDDHKVEMGTGALIDVENRTAVTAWHVVEHRTSAIVFFPAHDENGDLITDPSYYQDHAADLGIHSTVIAADSTRDVAVLQLSSVPSQATALPLSPHSAATAEEVHAIGNSGIDDGTLWRYSSGTVRSVYVKQIDYSHDDGTVQHVNAKVVETQCPTNPGDSGGPILNDQGQLVAITSGCVGSETNVEYGIDVSEVKTVLDTAGAVASNQPPANQPPAIELPAATPPPTLNVSPVNPTPPVSAQPPLTHLPPLTYDPVVPLPPVAPSPAAADPAARIARIHEVPDVYRNGKRGLEIHVELNIDNALGVPCDVVAVFADSSGHSLPAADLTFSTPDGRFRAAGTQVVARYASAHFSDVVLFMPYDEMTGPDAPQGRYVYTIHIDVCDTVNQTWLTQEPGEAHFTLNVNG